MYVHTHMFVYNIIHVCCYSNKGTYQRLGRWALKHTRCRSVCYVIINSYALITHLLQYYVCTHLSGIQRQELG